MISERHFVRSFSSFWNDIIPFNDFFIRDVNEHLYKRFTTIPLSTTTEPSRHALVNELAFRVFEHMPTSIFMDRDMKLLSDELVTQSQFAWNWALRFEKKDAAQFPLPDWQEMDEAKELAQRLRFRFLQDQQKPIFRPKFAGCGFIDECEGDFIHNDILYEVKAGDRSFLGSDIRQLILYSALNFQSSQYRIKAIGLVNPRHGMEFVMDINEVCVRIGSVEAPELLAKVIAFISGGGVSR